MNVGCALLLHNRGASAGYGLVGGNGNRHAVFEADVTQSINNHSINQIDSLLRNDIS